LAEISFDFPLPNGLHARPATALHEVVKRFGSTVTLTNQRSGLEGSASSVLALVATRTRQGDPCVLSIAGQDEAATSEALASFVATELPHLDDEILSRPAPTSEKRLPRALAEGRARVLQGCPAAGGVARGEAFVLARLSAFQGLAREASGAPDAELARLEAAIATVAAELRRQAAIAPGTAQAAIAGAHLAILEDPELEAVVRSRVGDGRAAAAAVLEAAEHFTAVLHASGSAVLAERAQDLADIAARLVVALHPELEEQAPDIPTGAILLADTLAPSRLMALHRGSISALALASAGSTSHTVVLARALGVPCVTALAGVTGAVASGQDLVVDGERGLVVLEPSESVAAFYEGERAKLETIRDRLSATRDALAVTRDGRRVEVGANVGSAAEARRAFACGADGIGLYRSELLFLEKAEPPSETAQAAEYTETVRAAGGRPVILRTLDVGGDKTVPYLGLPVEANPFLGLRAVRFYPERRELVKAQLRAVLRASAHGVVRIMVPMVSCLEEVREVRSLLAEASAELAAQGVAHAREVELGIMVEVPAAALLVDTFAKEVDFFSVGSNDLTQYTLAADRDNPHVAGLFSSLHPAVVRLLARIALDARDAGRRVGLCGELAGNPLALPLLVGLGFDELSLAAAGIPAVKAAIRRCDTPACRELAARAMACTTTAAVEELLRHFRSRSEQWPLVDAALVELDCKAASREEAIRRLVDLLDLGGRIDAADAVEDAVWVRETTATTSVGFGVAVPHCASPHVRAASLALVRLARPVEWGSLDGEGVCLAILIAVKAGEAGDVHLRTIAALARRLVDDEFRSVLLAAPDADAVVVLLAGAIDASTGGKAPG
jgi:multiphosphoryl transfer protein